MATAEVHRSHTLIPRWRKERAHLVANLTLGTAAVVHGVHSLNLKPLAAARADNTTETVNVDGEVEWSVENIEGVKKQVMEVGKKYVEVFRQFQTISNPNPSKELYDIYHDIWKANVKFREAHQLASEVSLGLLQYATDMYEVILPSLIDPAATDEDVHELLKELTEAATEQQKKLTGDGTNKGVIGKFTELKDDMVTLIASIKQKTSQLSADKERERDNLENNILPKLIADRDVAFDKWKSFMGAAIGVSIGLAIVSAVAACFIPPGTGGLVAALGTAAGKVAVGAALGAVGAAGSLGALAKEARDDYDQKCDEIVETNAKIRDLNNNISTFDKMMNTLNDIKPIVEVMSASIKDTEQLWKNVALQNDSILDKFKKAETRHGIAFTKTIQSCIPLFKLLKEVMAVYLNTFTADPGVVNEPIKPE